MRLPDALIGHLIEADLLTSADPATQGRIEPGRIEPGRIDLARRLVHGDVTTVPAATAHRFAPTVDLLLEQVLADDDAATVDELISDDTLDELERLSARLSAASAVVHPPEGIPVCVRYRADAPPVVLVLASEQAPDEGTRSAAQRLVHVALQDLGAQELARVPELRVPRPHWLTDPKADLAECVALLAATTGLPLPGAGVVAVGEWTGAAFRPLGPDELDVHRRAWRDDGRFGAFLAPTIAGWSLCVGQQEWSLNDLRHDLSSAAGVLFGDAWAAWRRERFGHVAAASRWSRADLTPRDDPLPEIDTPKIRTIVKAFAEDRMQVVIFGGGVKSGKRVTATRVVRQLRALHWHCVDLICGLDHTLTSRDELIQAGRAAFALDPGITKGNRLLVLLGMRPFETGRIGEILADVAKELGVCVFALPSYESGANTEWDTGGFPLVHAISGTEESRAFARQLVTELRDELGVLTDEQVDHAVRQHPANLWRLCQELRRLANAHEPAPDRVALLTGLTEAQRGAVALVAARALLSRESPDNGLDFLDEGDRGTLGFVAALRPGYVQVIDTSIAEDILLACDRIDGDADPDQHHTAAVHAALVRYTCRELCGAAQSGDRQTRGQIAIAITSARAYDFRVAQQIVKDFTGTPDFQDWRRTVGSDEIGSVLRAAGSLLGDSVRELCQMLAKRIHYLPCDQPMSTLLVLADVLRRHRTQLDDNDVESWLAWLRSATQRALRIGFAGRQDTYALLRLLLRLHDQKLNVMVAEGAPDLLIGLDHTSLRDCLQVYRIDQLVERATRRLGVVRAPLADHPLVRELLALPPARDSFAVALIRLALWVHFDAPEEWNDRFDSARPLMAAAITKDSAYDLHLALAQAGEIRVAFANRVLHEITGFSAAVADLIRSGTPPAETANLLTTIRRLHLHRAYQVLYRSDGSPDVDLAMDLTEIARDLNDGKGVGLLLSSLNAIDDNFRTTQSFGTLVAEELGLEWIAERIQLDSRPSTRYHLLKEIWAAEASYRGELVEAALQIITRTINTGVNAWGPQLALQLGQNPEFGWDVLNRVRDRIQDKNIFNGMIGLQNAQAQVHYHRLGRALFPHLAIRFSQEFDRTPLATNMISSSMSDMVASASAAAETMVTAGVPDAGRRVVAAVFGDAAAIETRLGRMLNPAELATALRGLIRLDPAVTREVVASMLEPDDDAEESTPDEPAVRTPTVLERRARQAMYDNPNSGVEFVTAVERAVPGAGRELVADLQGHHVWITFFGEVVHLQDPVELYIALRGLASVNVLPSTAGSGRLDRLYSRWRYRIDKLTSPLRAALLLRLFLIWGSQGWTKTIAHSMDFDNMGNRVARGRPDDLAAVPRLAEAMVLADHVGDARKLVELVVDSGAEQVTGRADLWQLCRLYECATRLGADTGEWLADALAARVSTTMAQAVIYDERTHWQAIGWAAHRLAADGVDISLPADIDIRPNMARPYLVGWAVSALPESDWRARELVRVRSLLHGTAQTTPAEAFCALMLRARLGTDFVGLSEQALPGFVKAMSFRQLTALQKIAPGAPEVAQLLWTAEPDLKVRSMRPLSRCEILATDVHNGFRHGPGHRR